MGGVTLTQNPMSETPGGAGGGAEGGDDSGWDAFAGYPFPTRVKLYWMANPGLRDFVLYVVFVIVFSIVSFEAKPGEVQFYINNMHKENLGRGLNQVTSHSGLYQWLKGNFANQAFPMYSPDAEPWNEVERLMVSGQARLMGAMRLRQVRSDSRECAAKQRMLEVDGYPAPVLCEEDYSFLLRSKAPVHARDSPEWAALDDFTRPFEFQSATELNTTLFFTESGELDTYYQDGYAMDIVPNVPPNTLATYFQDCEGIMNQSIATCMDEQNVFPEYEEENLVMPPPPPSPPPTSSLDDPVIVIFTDADDEGRPTEPSFFLERTITLSLAEPEQEVQFQLKNNGVLTIDWEALFFNANGTQLERWQDEVLWLSQDLNEEGSLSCTAAACDAVRFRVTVKAGQVNYLLTDDYVRAGQRKHAPNSPLDIVFQGIGWSDKRAVLRLNVFLDRSVPASGRRLSQIATAPAENIPEVCGEMNDVTRYVPAALVTDECNKVADVLNLCKLDYVAFQDMYRYMGASFCQGCACASPTDTRCVESCSAKALFISQVERMQAGQWLDKHTRAVILDVNLLNANYNLFSNVRLVVEFQSSGYVNPYVRVRTFKLYRYQSSYDYFVAAMEIAFAALVAYYIYVECVEIHRQGFSYLKHGWNYVDWANLIIALAVIGLRIVSLTRLDAFTFSSTSVQYIDFPTIGATANNELNIISLNFFLIYFKIFKYMANVPRMGSILQTLRFAAVDLMLFMVLVLIIYFGFSAAFYVCFGHANRDFRSLGDSVGALNRIVLGDYDYPALYGISPIMAQVLFYSFVLVVVFVVLSMFLALISDAYAEVKAQEPANLEFFTAITTRLFKRREDVEDLKTKLLGADIEGDARVSVEELKYALRDNPRALELLRTTTVPALMAKYDVDDDGSLSKEELTEILAELAEKEADIVGVIQEREAEATVEEARGPVSPEERAAQRNVARLRGYDRRLDGLSGAVKELSKNIAKKLSTMIDLMVSLSDQVSRGAVNSAVAPPTWMR